MARPASGRLFLLVEGGVLAALLVAWGLLSHGSLTAEDWAGFLLALTPLAIAAMVQTVPILAGGQGLAAGATALLVDAVIVVAPVDSSTGALLWIVLSLVIGGAVGLCNGFLIGYLRLPSTAVTYATGACVGALALMVVRLAFGGGDAMLFVDLPVTRIVFKPQLLGIPIVPIVLVAAIGVGGTILQRSRFGRALRVTGMRLSLAERALPAARLRCLAYVIAGVGYAIAGIVLAGQLDLLDSMMGMPVLLQIFAAAALGGSCPGLRAGSTVGALVGAAVVTATANVFVPLGIPDFLAPGIDAGWLLLGLAACWRFADRMPTIGHPPSAIAPIRSGAIAVIGIMLMVVLVLLRPEAGTLATMGAGIALLSLGQGAVIRSGGFDLSMPALITTGGMTAVTISQGSPVLAAVAAVIVVVGAVLLGLLHAALAKRLGRGIVVATLATGGAAQAIATAMFVWAPTGFVPLGLTAAASQTWFHLPLPAWILVPPAIIAAIALDRAWAHGHRDPRAAYIASTVAAAVFGMLIACVGGTYRVGLVDTFLVPAVAGAVIGGVRFARGDGSLLAAFGAALLVQVADTLLVALGLSYEARLMAVAAAMLAAATLPAITATRLPSSGRG